MNTPVLIAPLVGTRVLLVEDDDDSREVLTLLLTISGARVEAVSNAEDAIRAFGRSRPDVIVSDIGLPGASGYTLMRKIRSLEVGGPVTTPAVAVTAFARSEDRDEALAAGYQAHLGKPVEPDKLVAVVGRLAGVQGPNG